MPEFSDKSAAKLETCHPRLQFLCRKIITHYDFTVLEGHRSDERQEELFRTGKSKLRAGQSKHNKSPSEAVDIAPYPIDWDDRERFFILAGMMFQAASEANMELRWGGDFNMNWDFKDQSFMDLPHFELML